MYCDILQESHATIATADAIFSTPPAHCIGRSLAPPNARPMQLGLQSLNIEYAPRFTFDPRPSMDNPYHCGQEQRRGHKSDILQAA